MRAFFRDGTFIYQFHKIQKFQKKLCDPRDIKKIHLGRPSNILKLNGVPCLRTLPKAEIVIVTTGKVPAGLAMAWLALTAEVILNSFR